MAKLLDLEIHLYEHESASAFDEVLITAFPTNHDEVLSFAQSAYEKIVTMLTKQLNSND